MELCDISRRLLLSAVRVEASCPRSECHEVFLDSAPHLLQRPYNPDIFHDALSSPTKLGIALAIRSSTAITDVQGERTVLPRR